MIGEVYLDWNATAPPHPEVLRAMARAAENAWANPSSIHSAGQRARGEVERAREALAELLRVDSRDVILTSGATEANNLALRAAPALVVSRLEHPSVVRTAEALEREGRPVTWLPVLPSGRIDPEDVGDATARQPSGFMAVLMAANHETGAVQPVAEVANIVHAAGGWLHVDAVQAVGKIPPSAWAGADSLAFSAHKIRGPKGLGALAWSGAPPRPLLLGGAQERGVRPGTLDPIAAAGLARAAELALSSPARYADQVVLRDALERHLAAFGLINGADGPRLAHVTNASVDGWRGEELVAAMDLQGVRISSGSACSAGTTEPSETLTAMLGIERAISAVRLSLGDVTTRFEVETAISSFDRVLGERCSRASRIG